jgi:hypothetical protein
MSKTGLYEPFGHLQHKLWQKKKSRIKPLKVGNQLDLDVCRWGATHRWKALNESYNFVLDLIPIGGLNKEL